MIPYFKKRRNGSDAGVINEVWVDDCYRFKDSDIQGTVVDIGANIGAFTVLACLKGCTVLAFEPEPNNFKLLENNCLKNLVFPTLFNKGVGNPGFGYFQDNHGGTRKGLVGVKIQIVSLNDIITDEVDFLKMDCEGSEYEIICNTTDETLGKIKQFAAEFHPDLIDDQIHNDVIKRLEKFFTLEITGNIPIAGGIIYGARK